MRTQGARREAGGTGFRPPEPVTGGGGANPCHLCRAGRARGVAAAGGEHAVAAGCGRAGSVVERGAGGRARGPPGPVLWARTRRPSPWSPFPLALVQEGGGEAWGRTTGAKALFCFTAEMTLAGENEKMPCVPLQFEGRVTEEAAMVGLDGTTATKQTGSGRAAPARRPHTGRGLAGPRPGHRGPRAPARRCRLGRALHARRTLGGAFASNRAAPV